MKEMLEVYSSEGELIGQKEKKALHEEMRKEFIKTGKVSTRHKHVRLFLLTSNGRIILQRRSKWKGDNAGLWDKTIGGHVAAGESFDLTMLKECAEELGIPSTIVKEEEFEHSVATTDLHVLAILKKVAFLDNYQSSRKGQDQKEWVEPNMTQIYIGYYDGSIRFIDQESCGIQVFSRDELKEELTQHPEMFTEDIKYIMKKFAKLIKPITKINKVLND
ncbi:NUDIX domain-containing protein [archaeon]|jgi:isopentenyldiphosphate isomerase|nr:NUDIX domain-containing protein [archaeon]MBT6761435.1 NUDIX domain-containing protein [archaeon]